MDFLLYFCIVWVNYKNQSLKNKALLKSEVKTESIKCNTKEKGIRSKKMKRKETDQTMVEKKDKEKE